jgi:hypothetical protein
MKIPVFGVVQQLDNIPVFLYDVIRYFIVFPHHSALQTQQVMIRVP